MTVRQCKQFHMCSSLFIIAVCIIKTMSVNSFDLLLDNRAKHSQFQLVQSSEKPVLLWKKSFIMKRKLSGTKTGRDHLISKNEGQQQLFPVSSIFNVNLRKHSELCREAINDLEQNQKSLDFGMFLRRHYTTKEDWVNQKVKHLLSVNLEIQKSQTSYTKSYNTYFPVKKTTNNINSKNLLLKSSVTYSTIQKMEDAKESKSHLISALQKKAQLFDARYSNVLQLPQTQNQQIYNQRKKAHFAYFRQKQTKSSACNSRNRLSLESRTIDRDDRQLNDATVSLEKLEIQRFKNKMRFRPSTFPLQALRCHSLKKTVNSILILQQL